MWNGWRLWFNLAAGAVLALSFVPWAFAQYPSETKINLPEPPGIFQNLEGLGQKAMNFFGVETFARELQKVDFYGLFAKGRQFAAEKIPRYQAELRRICPAGCSLPEILRSLKEKIQRIQW